MSPLRAATRPLHRQVSGGLSPAAGENRTDLAANGRRAQGLSALPAEGAGDGEQGGGRGGCATMPHARRAQQKGACMGRVLALSDDTSHQLAALARHQQRTGEEMVRLCVAAYAAHHAPEPPQPLAPEADLLPEGEYPVVLASRRPPVQRLPGVVRTIREGPRELALTNDAWQTLGLEETADAG